MFECVLSPPRADAAARSLLRFLHRLHTAATARCASPAPLLDPMSRVTAASKLQPYTAPSWHPVRASSPSGASRDCHHKQLLRAENAQQVKADLEQNASESACVSVMHRGQIILAPSAVASIAALISDALVRPSPGISVLQSTWIHHHDSSLLPFCVFRCARRRARSRARWRRRGPNSLPPPPRPPRTRRAPTSWCS